MYPILKRLENSGHLNTYTVEHNSRLRKYYRITEKGRDHIREILDEWQQIMGIYEFVKGAAEHE